MATIGEFVEYLKTLPQDTKVKIVYIDSYTDLTINKDVEGKFWLSDCFHNEKKGIFYIGET